jgi:hypothetical protein
MKYFLLCCFLFLISAQEFAQYQNVMINNPSSTDPEEVSIAIDPSNPNYLAAGANINYAYRSTNGGFNWSQQTISSSLGVWGDPCLVFDDSGNLYYIHLSWATNWIDRIVCQRSTDHGVTFNDGAGIGLNTPPKAQDKAWLSVDMTNSSYHGNLYVTWTEFDSYGSSSSSDSSRIRFSRSTDFGITWSPAITISDVSGDCIDSDNTDEGAVPCVGPDGQIYVSWAGPLGLVFDKSTDGGVTWGNDIFVSDIPGGWDFAISGIYRANGLPITACDTGSTSPYKGNIYINWSDQRNGSTNTDVFFVKSTDGGNTWTSPLKVNDDNTTREQFFTWMTIDQTTGFIYCCFYDRRNTTGAATDVYVARSTDGGDSFDNFIVSESSFTPTSGVFFGDYTNIAAYNRMVYPMWMRLNSGTLSVWTAIINDSTAGVPVELTSFDYTVSAGNVNLNWKTATEINNRGFEIQRSRNKSDWATIGYVDGNGTTTGPNEYTYTDEPLANGTYYYRLKQFDFDGHFEYSKTIEVDLRIIKNFALEQNYPNPFNPTTTIGFELPTASNVIIKVFDVLGSEVATLVNSKMPAGIHEVRFDGSKEGSGIYIYRMTTNNFSVTKKMILMK